MSPLVTASYNAHARTVPHPEPVATANEIVAGFEVVAGVVTRGFQLGRQLGFPTANIPLAGRPQPRTGVYAVRSRLADGRVFFGVANVGCNPTIPKEAPMLEVWLFDFDEDIYDQTLSTELLTYLREEHRFGSIEALIEQVFADAEQARRYCKDHAVPLT